MSVLRTDPGSSSAAQRKVLVIEGKRKGLSLDALRDLAGGSLRQLSADGASKLIRNVSGMALKNPPGSRPPARSPTRPGDGSPLLAKEGAGGGGYRRKRSPGVVGRLVTDGHVDQIRRLLANYFGENWDAAEAWLRKNFKVQDVRCLGTAERAGQVISVLKRMIERKN